MSFHRSRYPQTLELYVWAVNGHFKYGFYSTLSSCIILRDNNFSFVENDSLHVFFLCQLYKIIYAVLARLAVSKTLLLVVL